MNRYFCFAVFLLLMTLNGQKATAEDPLTSGPRDGKYLIYIYSTPAAPALYNGYFVLSARTYKAYLPGDKLSGEGRYSFHADSNSVSWDSGPYAGVWQGAFTIEREGKTHKIRLQRNTVATNSTDS